MDIKKLAKELRIINSELEKIATSEKKLIDGFYFALESLKDGVEDSQKAVADVREKISEILVYLEQERKFGE